jgi:hypothetical protein
VLWLISAGILAGCIGSSEERIRARLDRLLDEDLSAIAGEIRANDSTALLDRPYYRILEYQVTPQGGSYTHKCKACFYYLKKIKMKQIRKYRYKPDTGEWERYEKKIVYNLAGT